MMHNDSEESEEDENSVSSIVRVRENDPDMTRFLADGDETDVQNMTDDDWEELGRDISNNTHLKEVTFSFDALNDQKISFLFRGLTRSSSIGYLNLQGNEFLAAGVRSMVPFLQNTNNLKKLDLQHNNLQSEGFNDLCRALHDSPIEELDCSYCGIESIDIDSEHVPRNLKELCLRNNSIYAVGCRGLAKLLQGADSTLTTLIISGNSIDDECIAILVDALESDTSLQILSLMGNDGISRRGQVLLLKLVNDVSSIKATLQSNHTLTNIYVDSSNADEQIQGHIEMATKINNFENYPEAAGRANVIETQLNSVHRAE